MKLIILQQRDALRSLFFTGKTPTLALLAVVALLTCAGGVPARAQLRAKLDHYSTRDGLTHEVIADMIKGRDGYFWFSSWGGLTRFDGHNFVSWSPTMSSGVGNSRIDQIVEGAEEHLWVRAYDLQVYRFNKRTESYQSLTEILKLPPQFKVSVLKLYKFKEKEIWLRTRDQGLFFISESALPNGETNVLRFAADQPAAYHLPSNHINFINSDSQGTIWLGTRKGLVAIKKNKSSAYRTVPVAYSCLSENEFSNSAEDKDNLYFVSGSGAFIIYNKSSNTIVAQKSLNEGLNAVRPSRFSPMVYLSGNSGTLYEFNRSNGSVRSHSIAAKPLHQIFEDSKGRLWIEPKIKGAYLFEPQSGRSRYLTEDSGDGERHDDGHYNVFEDKNNRVWLCMKGQGFGYYDDKLGRIETTYRGTDGMLHRFPKVVFGALYDPRGYLWLRSEQRGLDKLSLTGDVFSSHMLTENAEFRLENEVRGLLSDKHGRLWAGSKSGDLVIYDRNKLTRNLFVNKPPGGFGSVYCLFEDKHDNIWIGTKGHGLFRARPLDPHGKKYVLEHFKNLDSSGATAAQVYSIASDAEGRIWVGTFDAGLFVSNLSRSVFSKVNFVSQNLSGNNYEKVRSVAPDSKGNIWVGTTDGLIVLSRLGKSTKYQLGLYSSRPGGLPNNDVQYVYHDTRGGTWLCTSGGGLSRALGDRPVTALRFKRYGKEHGLQSDYILGAAEDRRGRLWLSSPAALSCFDLKSGRVTVYDANDGLPESSFSEGSLALLKDGHLAMGMMKGFILFDPNELGRGKKVPPLVFTDFLVNGRSKREGRDSSANDYLDINYQDELTLNYDENNFSIEFTVLDFKGEGKHRYSYRLKGLDEAWQYNNSLRRASFTNIPPGRYLLEVKTGQGLSDEKQAYRSIAIHILPPWWQTWWAYCAYLIIGASLLWYVRRNLITVLKLRQQVLVEKKLTELKLNFFSNISHELRTPLTLILNPIEELARNENIRGRDRQYVELVNKNAQRMQRFMNQLLDLRKVQHGAYPLKISRVEIIGFTRRVLEYFTELSSDKGISIVLHSNVAEIWTWLDIDKMDIVIYNLLSNALKYSDKGKAIRIHILERSGGKFLLQVEDEGRGVDPAKVDKIFELYYCGGNITAAHDKGIGIGLTLCKEYVSMHKGNITAFNNASGGLTVELCMHTGAEHFQESDFAAAEHCRQSNVPDCPGNSLLNDAQAILAGPERPLILLVEDNAELRFFLKGQLQESYRVQLAENGREGLEQARRLLPDVIISDLMMPEMDGIQLLNEIKQDQETSHIPFVLLTARCSVQSQIEGLDCGADLYITKPFNMDLLRASVTNILRARKQLFEARSNGSAAANLNPSPVPLSSIDRDFLDKVLATVEQGMVNTDFNIEMCAENIGMSRASFYKKFKSLTCMAPIEFVKDMRLKRAVQYMEAGDSNISGIAYKSGFNNPKYFSTCFKEKYKLSPKEYLKQYETRRTDVVN